MAGELQGKLIGVKVNGSYVRCQTDATLSISQDVTDNDPCKPTESETTNGANWAGHTQGQKSWTISVTAKSFADVAAGTLDNSDIAKLMIEGDNSVEVTFQTIRTTDYAFASVFIYEGTGTLTSFTHNAPVDGDSTFDLEITGNGALTFEETPVTS